MQHGEEAYNEMLENIHNIGSKHVGDKHNKKVVVEHKGYTVGIIVFSLKEEPFSEEALYWCQPEYNEVEKELECISDCDFRIVYMHWGDEFIEYPSTEQKKFAHWLIDVGSDLVVGAHPHVLQGFEKYNGKYIFYSLGNFLFNMSVRMTSYAAVLNIDIINGKLEIGYDYVKTGSKLQPLIISEDEVPAEYTFESLNQKLSLNSDNDEYYRQMFKRLSSYRRKNHWIIIRTLFKHNYKELLYTLFQYLRRRLIR
jgi:hypothetical protein